MPIAIYSDVMGAKYRHLLFILLTGLLSLLGPDPAQSAEVQIVDCHKLGQTFDAILDKCIDRKAPATAVQLMAPLLGAHGSVLTPDDIKSALEHRATGSAANAGNANGAGGGTHPTDSPSNQKSCDAASGGYQCRDGTKRMCALIPGLPPTVFPWHLFSVFSSLAASAVLLRRRIQRVK